MKVTFSQEADMILSRHSDFRERLLGALEGDVATYRYKTVAGFVRFGPP